MKRRKMLYRMGKQMIKRECVCRVRRGTANGNAVNGVWMCTFAILLIAKLIQPEGCALPVNVYSMPFDCFDFEFACKRKA